ncbi:NAD(P)-binding protein [Punctularia strigosozonata HHB-11173 SS5]|uniref:NAD(P)-binding protein n=1 Tax=Punctularia strigosozonata (strain HHB-11173) TaxID=741275 RepID=R7S459_PUNST|nr:NAD(P)-binding protein [Punctularia strigosozonata HHB-11173 SS5]EIN05165.1 NAD(P)-binding protein [Punctularia strigosozonata HHB-11173 SS5]
MSLPTTTREYRLPEYKGPSSLVLKEANVAPPKSHEVLVKIKAVSLQYRDLIVSKGQYPLGVKENVVPGSDCAGEIIAVGDSVTAWKKGDRVMPNFSIDHLFGLAPTPESKATGLGAPIDGVLTEYRVFPAYSLIRVPPNLSYEEASCLPCAGLTAYNALFGPSPLRAGDSVLVQGTGGVSVFGLQIARAAGATVIATSSSDDKLVKAKQLGATHVINYKKVPNWEDEVLRITNGEGVDYVVEVGGVGTLPKSVKAVKMGGVVSLIGFVTSSGDVSSLPINVITKAFMLRGILIGSVEQFQQFVRLVEANDLHPVINKVFDFEHAREAYEYLKSQQHVGKVVIKVAKD